MTSTKHYNSFWVYAFLNDAWRGYPCINTRTCWWDSGMFLRVSGIPEMRLRHPATKQKLRIRHPLMKCHFFVWWCAVVYTKYSLVWTKIRIKWPNAASIIQTCNNDGITFGKFLPSEASAILGCPKLEFRAPVGTLWCDVPPGFSRSATHPDVIW